VGFGWSDLVVSGSFLNAEKKAVRYGPTIPRYTFHLANPAEVGCARYEETPIDCLVTLLGER
jgi:hypothetical protein